MNVSVRKAEDQKRLL